MTSIFDVDHVILARHFGHSTQNMRVLKKNYQKWLEKPKGKPNLWPIYCKAYAYDKGVEWFQKDQLK